MHPTFIELQVYTIDNGKITDSIITTININHITRLQKLQDADIVNDIAGVIVILELTRFYLKEKEWQELTERIDDLALDNNALLHLVEQIKDDM